MGATQSGSRLLGTYDPLVFRFETGYNIGYRVGTQGIDDVNEAVEALGIARPDPRVDNPDWCLGWLQGFEDATNGEHAEFWISREGVHQLVHAW